MGTQEIGETNTDAGDIILGIDPGLNVSGYGVIRAQGSRCHLIEAGVIRSRKGFSIERRIADIHEGILEVVQQHQPAHLALEQLFSHQDGGLRA